MMWFEPENLKINYTKCEYAIADTRTPVFSWGAVHSVNGSRQKAFHITVTFMKKLLWDSGIVYSEELKATYGGLPLPSGAEIEYSVELFDNNGNKSSRVYSSFKTACFDNFKALWIEADIEKGNEVIYFKKDFKVSKKPVRAVLYYCGLGLCKPYLNDRRLEDYYLRPSHSNYEKECYYTTLPLDASLLNTGDNTLMVQVAGGWRKNTGAYLDNISSRRKIEFMGNMCLFCELKIYYDDGTEETVATDESWLCGNGPILYSHLFNGETYNENISIGNFSGVKKSEFMPQKFTPDYLEPVCVKEEIKPKNEYFVSDKKIYDFGENLAGIIKLRIFGECADARFILRHAEEISETGDLFTDTLRSARSEDIFILADGICKKEFVPQFTYHGFRYASLEICGSFSGRIEISALKLYTDIDTDGFFKCGDADVNRFYETALQTERSNLHSIATDCPQRDERMAWMNDATVRFMSMSCNFNIARLFQKITADIKNEQDEFGRLTCTAPFVYGERPADPVCAAYFVAALEHYKLTGDKSVIKEHYQGFKAWIGFLKSKAADGIVDYSYYGDWAGPEDCCYSVDTIGNSDVLKTEEYDTGAANSSFVPGEMISTAIYYMNINLMIKLCEIINENDKDCFANEAKRIRQAFLKKWFDKHALTMHNNSQAVLALVLFVDILPKECTAEMAEKLANRVIADGYRIKTANITTPMLFDVLAKYGYNDIAWKVFTGCDYPSFGYMFRNGATTFWERFELKKDRGMNSHNHPMYAASIGYLYRSVIGFDVQVPDKIYTVSPKIPKELLYVEAKIPVLSGYIYIKIEKKYGKILAHLNVPFGVSVNLNLEGEEKRIESGFHTLCKNDEEREQK